MPLTPDMVPGRKYGGVRGSVEVIDKKKETEKKRARQHETAGRLVVPQGTQLASVV